MWLNWYIQGVIGATTYRLSDEIYADRESAVAAIDDLILNGS